MSAARERVENAVEKWSGIALEFEHELSALSLRIEAQRSRLHGAAPEGGLVDTRRVRAEIEMLERQREAVSAALNTARAVIGAARAKRH